MPSPYATARWKKLRAKVLRAHPLCAMHLGQGKLVAAEVVDHIRPHRGDEAMFWDEANLQALCKRCHDSVKQRFEKSGVEIGCDDKGFPIAPNSHWMAPRRG